MLVIYFLIGSFFSLTLAPENLNDSFSSFFFDKVIVFLFWPIVVPCVWWTIMKERKW